ncbi:c-type cytochrome [Novosphingobium terrae]|uniref:c-type cytochrome n=1 Tax=Novosphingobium terrae TaxID=2726189 RepID=UPI00197F7624|nr:hypothetical protein [Novosphingobium terrae]
MTLLRFRILISAWLILPTGLAPSIAIAGDIPAGLGERLVTQGSSSGVPGCMSCHGAQLHGIAALKSPAIAGLSSAFILTRLEHYAGPQGHNAQMKLVSTGLTMPERQAVAIYLSSLKP